MFSSALCWAEMNAHSDDGRVRFIPSGMEWPSMLIIEEKQTLFIGFNLNMDDAHR